MEENNKEPPVQNEENISLTHAQLADMTAALKYFLNVSNQLSGFITTISNKEQMQYLNNLVLHVENFSNVWNKAQQENSSKQQEENNRQIVEEENLQNNSKKKSRGKK